VSLLGRENVRLSDAFLNILCPVITKANSHDALLEACKDLTRLAMLYKSNVLNQINIAPSDIFAKQDLKDIESTLSRGKGGIMKHSPTVQQWAIIAHDTEDAPESTNAIIKVIEARQEICDLDSLYSPDNVCDRPVRRCRF
jgi:hypothetical protein